MFTDGKEGTGQGALQEEKSSTTLNASGRNRRLGGPRTAKCSPIFQLAVQSIAIQAELRRNGSRRMKANLIQRPQKSVTSKVKLRMIRMRWRLERRTRTKPRRRRRMQAIGLMVHFKAKSLICRPKENEVSIEMRSSPRSTNHQNCQPVIFQKLHHQKDWEEMAMMDRQCHSTPKLHRNDTARAETYRCKRKKESTDIGSNEKNLESSGKTHQNGKEENLRPQLNYRPRSRHRWRFTLKHWPRSKK